MIFTLSVIVPYCNMSKYLSETFDSLKNQGMKQSI